MSRRNFLIFTSLILAVAFLAWTPSDALAKKGTKDDQLKKFGKMTTAEQKAAAKRAKEKGLLPGAAGLEAAALPLPGIEGPGGVPHYFGPYGNWAFSPLPSFGLLSTVTVDSPGSGYTNPIVTITDVYGTGTDTTGNPVIGTATFDADGAITAISVPAGTKGFHVPFVNIVDNPTLCGGNGQPACGTGAAATATLDLTTLAGGIRKFVDSLPGVPGATPFGANNLGQYIPLAVPEERTFSGQAADYYEIALVEYTEKMHSDLPPTKLRGYVQVETDNVKGIGYPLPGGKAGVTKPHYLGPIIVAKGRVHGIPNTNPTDPGYPKPVRIKFYNLLPAGAGGDLLIPVDETVMGSGYGPAGPGGAGNKYTQNRATIHLHGNNTVWISDGNVHQWITPANEDTPYPAGVSARNVPDMKDTLGNIICDADPVNNPGRPGSSGCQTFFYTNAQSARLQFYHDHAMGITRLNVYVGEAAGYVLTDQVDQDMINGTNVSGVNIASPPGSPTPFLKVLPDIGIPLIIQDRTWVDADTVFAQDPTWNSGTGPRAAPVPPETIGRITEAVTGDLWYPHVYMTVQNPWDLTGTNAVGRWHYGPWFNPPTPTCVNGLPVGCVEVGPVPNPYYTPICETDPASPDCHAWEPPMMPGNPNPSMPGESFLDTQVVNGTVYPYLEVEPKAYRFRVLNAANDRMLNLQLYEAYTKTSWVPGTGAANPGTPTAPCGTDPTVCTEVKMVPVSVAPANQFADTPSGIPDPTKAGPPWILIGTEGGFMPKPVVVPQQPIGYNVDPAYFSFGLVNQHSLFLGSAERADVVVDFSAFKGKTLILYNDSPAPVPAGAAPYDFYTGNGDQIDGGGAPNTQPGYGPNSRTIMQIRVGTTVSTPTTDVTLANLNAVFAKTGTKRGVFEVSQDPIIIPQAAYNSAYGANFPSTATKQYVQIADTQKTFQPINEAGVLQPAVTLPLEMKAMHDEMGGVYDTLFGRMSGMLGLSNPLSPIHVLIPYGLAAPPTDLVKGSLEGTPIGVMPDGTQIWRIFHNGVDTHTIHTHLFHTQLINRVDQSGQVTGGTLPVDPIELGWKDTFRVNPLEVTYLAMRPTVPTPAQLPFEAPDSVRLIDPTLPEGATLIPPPPAGWFRPDGTAIPEILNHFVNFGWEYVWHCHILSHEEMDMMHSLVFAVPPRAPTALTAVVSGRDVTLTWIDNSLKEVQFTIQRATNATFTTGLTTFNYVNPSTVVPNTVTFIDKNVPNNSTYWYRVFANGAPVGDLLTAGFPTMSADAVSDTIVRVDVGTTPTAVPADPTLLTATVQAGPQVSLTWRDNATNETGFVVERSTDNGATWTQIATPGPRNNTGNVTYVDTTVTFGNTYFYRVWAVNAAGPSDGPTNQTSAIVPVIPAAPTNFRVAIGTKQGNNYPATLTWQAATNPTSFTIQRATNATFTTGLNTVNPAGSARSLTQTLNRNTTYYYRIRANNNVGGSSAWTNALPFPIRTGP